MTSKGIRRSEALRQILKVFEEWSPHQPDLRAAEEVLTLLEKKANMTTYWFERVYDKGMNKHFDLVHPGWKPEKKKTRKKRK